MNKMFSSSPDRLYVAFTTLPTVRKFYIPEAVPNTIDGAWTAVKRFLEPGELITACGPYENFAFLKDVQDAEVENLEDSEVTAERQLSYLTNLEADILDEEIDRQNLTDLLERDLTGDVVEHAGRLLHVRK